MVDGSQKKIDMSSDFRESYRDEYAQELIPQSWVQEAILDEVSYFNEKVWLGIPLEEAMQDAEGKVISGRWVICNNEDSQSPDVRARYVAQEIAAHEDTLFYASTPPVESKRMLLSQWATERERERERGVSPLKLSFIDVRKAYFNGRSSRTLYVRLPGELGPGKNTVARLERCMYGCRDSGAIWEATYTQALLDMGFVQGVASPCCVHHAIWDIACVVHGDDFTALGAADSLSLYERAMCEAFECTIKGRLGREGGDVDEMRVLNRVARVVPSGLRYEPDPRHAELLIRALGLEDAKHAATPGYNIPFEEIEHAPSDLQDVDDLVAAVRLHTRVHSKVSFSNTEPEAFDFPSWYQSFPRTMFFSGPVGSENHLYVDSSTCSLDTGTLFETVEADRCLLRTNPAERRRIRMRTLQEGAAWEISSSQLSAAMARKKKLNKKRVGARAARLQDKLRDPAAALEGGDATSFRALAARANYLALDRPDIAFCNKELCRSFSSPTSASVTLLKRLVRYLLGKTRLVWSFDHQPMSHSLVGSVDTDFAGCLVTRRSTAGGVATRGRHLIKHWADTQATVALSSGEAELGGICKGASACLGLVSVARDLGAQLESAHAD